MDIVENVRKNIRTILTKKKITQAKLADKLDISYVYLSRLLSGVKGEGLKVSFVQNIANALEVDICDLLASDEPHIEIKDKELTELIVTLETMWQSANRDQRGWLKVTMREIQAKLDADVKRELGKTDEAKTA